MATSTSGQKQIKPIQGKLVVEEGNSRITLYDTTDNVYRMIIGILPDGTIGIAISKEGEDVFDAFAT